MVLVLNGRWLAEASARQKPRLAAGQFSDYRVYFENIVTDSVRLDLI